MGNSHLELIDLLQALDPEAPLAERHLWLMRVLDWVRGNGHDVEAAVLNVRTLLDAAELRPDWVTLWHQWWSEFLTEVDATPLLADLGFAQRNAFFSELSDRLRRKMVWATPETTDLRELFTLLFPHEFDARWLRALDKETLDRIGHVLFGVSKKGNVQNFALDSLLNALGYAISQISAVGQTADVRTRMSSDAQRARPFVKLPIVFFELREAVLNHGRLSAPALVALGELREQLDACRSAASSVYIHLEKHGISVHLEFQLRQLRQRIIRVKALLLCLETDAPTQATAQLLSHLVRVNQDSSSVTDLIRSSTQLLASRVTERNAETGEHYITHDWVEYLKMLWAAAGGGAVMALTTVTKLLIMSLALSAFWGGVAAGWNYAISFVVIMLLGWTVATKQPAMTAPTLAARLNALDADAPETYEDFTSEVVYLLRSQFVAIVGNVALVLLTAYGLAKGIQALGWHPLISDAQATQILADHHAFGRTIPWAILTGVLLFASSIIAGWVENWFVLNRVDSVMTWNPHVTRWLGAERAQRWGQYWHTHIANWTANISLGLMLGLVPPFISFFGIPTEVRHVTLVSGQIAVAAQQLGASIWSQPILWWAAGGILMTGFLDVAVSFYMAYRLALTAQNVTGVNRRQIYQSMAWRLLKKPWSFILPTPITASSVADSPALIDHPPISQETTETRS